MNFSYSEEILTKENVNNLLVSGINNIRISMTWKSFNESYSTYSDVLEKVQLFQDGDLKLINHHFVLKNNSNTNEDELFKQYFKNEIVDKINSLEIEVRYLKNRIIAPDYDSSNSSLERPIRLQQFLKEWRTTLKSINEVILNSNYPNFNEIKESINLNKNNISNEVLSSFKDCDDFYCPELIIIPTGSFLMGVSQEEEDYFNGTLAKNELDYSKPLHKVTITKSFAMSNKEVTLNEFRQFILETGFTMPKGCETPILHNRFPDFLEDKEWDYNDPGFVEGGYPNKNEIGFHPVVCVRREDGRRYAEWLSKKTNQKYRLPYESEWEYVARANKGNYVFTWGNEKSDACTYANVLDQSTTALFSVPSKNGFPCNDSYPTTAKVGNYLPNDFKIHDMAGNAREWMEDCWHDSFENAPSDGSVWNYKDKHSNPMCKFQVLRGGGWIYDITHLRLAYRNAYYSSQIRSNMWGFRLVREL